MESREELESRSSTWSDAYRGRSGSALAPSTCLSLVWMLRTLSPAMSLARSEVSRGLRVWLYDVAVSYCELLLIETSKGSVSECAAVGICAPLGGESAEEVADKVVSAHEEMLCSALCSY